jgi:hypothetical protein
MRPVFLLLLLISSFSAFSTTGFAEEEGPSDDSDGEETSRLNIQYSEVRARVSPTFEVALPSGELTLSFTQPFNRLDLIFYLGYGVISSDIDTELTFAYNIKRFRPYVKFFQKTDFENLVAPAIVDSGIVLVPTEKYIDRRRGFELGVDYRLAQRLYLEPAFLLDDVFKGSLTEARILDEGVDLTLKLSFIFDGVTALDPSDNLYFAGAYYRTILATRFRDTFNVPVSMRSENLYLHFFTIRNSWYFKLRGSLNYPIAVWEDELADFYQLGGFDTIRGYEDGSINAFSFLLFTVDTEYELFKERELSLLKDRLRFHQFRFTLLADSLLFQDSIGLQSDIQYLSSLGAGISAVISGRGNSHFRTELFVAQGIQSGEGPILYFRTSLFNLETSFGG